MTCPRRTLGSGATAGAASGAVTVRASLEAYQGLTVEAFAHSGRIAESIGEAVTDRGEPGGAGVTEPSDLDGCGAREKGREPVVRGVPCEVDEHVDSVGADLLDQCLVGPAHRRAPVVTVRTHASGDGVGPRHLRIGEHLNVLAAMRLQ